MARSERPGIRYFSVDVDILSDRKVRRVLAACGPEAMAVVLRLLCDIYGDRGYYARSDDDYLFDVADALGMETGYVQEVVRRCVGSGFFDAGMWERFGILTSRRVQRNFLDATYRRVHNNSILPEYCLLDEVESSDGDNESDIRKGLSDDAKVEPDIQSTQTKLNKTKLNQIKENQTSNAGVGGLLPVSPYVSLREEEMRQLKAEYGEAGMKRMIEMLGDYKASSGKRYASDYHAIRSWVVKRWQEEQANPPRQPYERPVGQYDHLATDPFRDTPPIACNLSEVM